MTKKKLKILFLFWIATEGNQVTLPEKAGAHEWTELMKNSKKDWEKRGPVAFKESSCASIFVYVNTGTHMPRAHVEARGQPWHLHLASILFDAGFLCCLLLSAPGAWLMPFWGYPVFVTRLAVRGLGLRRCTVGFGLCRSWRRVFGSSPSHGKHFIPGAVYSAQFRDQIPHCRLM